EAYLLADRLGDAWMFAEKTLALGGRLGQRRLEALALYLLGEVACRGDLVHMRTAAEHYRKALGLAEGLGMLTLVGHCHLGLGKVARRLGDGKRARAYVSTAANLYRGMGMPFWQEKAAAEIG